MPYNLVTPSNPGFENTFADGWIPHNISNWEITVDSLGADDYLLINKRAAAYYRVIYDESNCSLYPPVRFRQVLPEVRGVKTTSQTNLMEIC